MRFAWTAQNTAATGGGLLDPYADWERTNRFAPGAAQVGTLPILWQPVYVELAPFAGQSPAAAANALLDAEAAAAADLRFHEDTWWRLRVIAGLGAAAMTDLPAQHHRFFLFRPEDVAPLPDPYPVRVLQIGPAIPFTRAGSAQPSMGVWDKERLTTPAGQVLTAVIDDQIGFANARFRNRDGTTRIERLWLQGMPFQRPRDTDPGGQVIGRELTKQQIDTMLRRFASEDDIYRHVYAEGVPFMPAATTTVRRVRHTNLSDPTHIRPYAFQAGHGTHVLDLAAGWPCDDAPTDRPILAVQIPTLATAETWGARLDLFILLAVTRILHWADNPMHGTPLPVVINISYGTSAGPKDGTGFLEAEIARLVSLRHATTPTVVVLPSGNGYRAHTHARMTLTAGTRKTVTQRVQPEDMSVSFTEIWLDDAVGVTLTITPPLGAPSPAIALHQDAVLDWQRDRVTIGRIYVQRRAGQRLQVTFALCPTQNHQDAAHAAPPGAYRLTLAKQGAGTTVADIDVQRDDTPTSFPQYGRQSYLDDQYVGLTDPETYDLAIPDPADSQVSWQGTLSAHATAQTAGVVVVGAAYDRHAFERASLYAASGATLPRGGPDLAAICEESRSHAGSLATGLFSGSVSLFSGTSMAAPRVTRAIVDKLAAGAPWQAADLVAAPALPTKDARLGLGVMPYRAEPGRLARRIRS